MSNKSKLVIKIPPQGAHYIWKVLYCLNIHENRKLEKLALHTKIGHGVLCISVLCTLLVCVN